MTTGKFVIELDFKAEVLNLKFREGHLLVVTLNQLQVFSFDETLYVTERH